MEDLFIAAPIKTGPRPGGPRPNARPGQKPNNVKKDEAGLRINDEITASQVRLVGENIQEQGVYSLREALRMADEQELDLVEISAKADPPVCRILDYQI